MTEEKRTILTNETKTGKVTEADESLATGPYKKIESVDEFKEMAIKAMAVHEASLEMAEKLMTKERADEIRKLRCNEGYTWRAVALECSESWGDDFFWYPPTNQLAGMALCEIAAGYFDEDHEADPWN